MMYFDTIVSNDSFPSLAANVHFQDNHSPEVSSDCDAKKKKKSKMFVSEAVLFYSKLFEHV